MHEKIQNKKRNTREDRNGEGGPRARLEQLKITLTEDPAVPVNTSSSMAKENGAIRMRIGDPEGF